METVCEALAVPLDDALPLPVLLDEALPVLLDEALPVLLDEPEPVELGETDKELTPWDGATNSRMPTSTYPMPASAVTGRPTATHAVSAAMRYTPRSSRCAPSSDTVAFKERPG